MWRFAIAPTIRLADTAGFLAALNEQAEFFDDSAPVYVARAPGRLDLMGGIADYSGSLVLELPLAAGTFVAAQPVAEPIVTIQTVPADEFDGQPRVEIPLAELAPPARPSRYAEAQGRLRIDRRQRWAAYVAGGIMVLHRECGAEFGQGRRLFVYSEVPLGKGVSSSAALEIASLCALARTCDLDLSGREIALLGQIVENRVVNAPCGVMDQMTSACGQQDHLLALLCQPAEPQGSVRLPPNVEVWGIDSGVRHDVSGADYTSVRVGAFMGYRILAQAAGLPVHAAGEGRVEIDDNRWGGYLANVTPAEWETLRSRVPKTLTGAEFLKRYGGTTDPVTRVEPDRSYALWPATAHPIYEHRRVRRFREILLAGVPNERKLTELGHLMYASHTSYSVCGLGSGSTDHLVDLVRAAGPDAGLYGAKITGGGSGGTVAILAARHSFDEVKRIATLYAEQTGRAAALLGGSSPGALQFGVWLLRN